MQTGEPELLRAINRFHVLDCVRRFEPISRVEIGERTRLSRATVSAIAAALIEEGLLHDDAADTTPPAPSAGALRGRPRIMLRMNPNAAHVVGIKLSMHQVSISVTNLKAEVLSSLVMPVRTRRLGAEVVADLVEDAVRVQVAKAGLTLDRIAGIGIGVPGFVDSAAGLCRWSPIFGHGDVPFAAMVAGRLGCPTVIENDANLVTLAERWFGHGQDVDTFVVVTVEHGVGMGMVLHGELYRGHHGLGAEFGHTKHDPAGPPCRCGQRGCVEAYVADYALLREARAALGQGLDQRLDQGLDQAESGDDMQAEQLLDRITDEARQGDARLCALFARAGAVLGQGVANLVSILDPAKIILCGAGMRAADLLMPALRLHYRVHAPAHLAALCELVVHDQGDEVWARGAASLVLEHIYRAPWSRTAAPTMPG